MRPAPRSFRSVASRRWGIAAHRRCGIFRSIVFQGEIFGVAGVDGNGQKELGEVIAGQRHITAGHVLLDGADITNRGVTVSTRLGIGYVTDDRMHEGCVAAASITENVALKAIGRKPFSNGFWLNRRAMEDEARRLIADFDVQGAGSPDSPSACSPAATCRNFSWRESWRSTRTPRL